MSEPRYTLTHLTDKELLDSLATLSRRSDELTAELIAHLAEVEARRLHVVQGYSSMFEYCLSCLGATEDEAGRRIHAARAARRFPELLPMLARGEMHLSTINLIAARFGDDDQAARGLIDAARGKTKRQVEEILAVRFAPKREAPTRLVPLASVKTPAAARNQPPEAARDGLPLFAAVEAPAMTPPVAVAAPSSASLALPTTTAPRQACAPSSPKALLSDSSTTDAPAPRFRLEVTISRETRDHLLRAQALLAHTIPDGDVGRVLERALALLCEELEVKKLGKLKRHDKKTSAAAVTGDATAVAPTSECTHAQAAEEPVPGRAADAPSDSDESVARKRRGKGGARPRTIPRAVRRQVAERDGCRCAYVSPEGMRCSETRRLEFNHKTPFARGGEATVDGVDLLCRVHNDLQARLDYGEAHMQAAKARRRAEREKHQGPEA